MRARLVLLVLLVLAAPVGALLHGAAQQRSEGLTEVAIDARLWSELAVVEHQQRVEAGHQFLEALAQTPALATQDGNACSQLVAGFLEKYGLYANVSAATPDGRVFCSARPATFQDQWAGQRWFQQVSNSYQVVVGDYSIDPVSGVPVLLLAHPIRDDQDRLQAVISALLPMDWLAHYARGPLSGGDGALTILDGTGRTLLSYPAPERWLGLQDTVAAFNQAIHDAPEAGNVDGVGVDGIRRLYAYVRLAAAPAGEVRYIRIGRPAEEAYASVDRQLRSNLTMLATSALVALLIAWWAGGLLVLRPLGSLLHATDILRGGDLSARTGPPYASGELGQLAHAFDGMADSLAAREAARQRVEAEVRALNAQLERRVDERTTQLEIANRNLLKNAEEQSTLYRISAAIASILEPQELLSKVVEIVMRALAADAGWVLVAEGVMGVQRRVPVWRGVPETFVAAETEVPAETCLVCDLLAGKNLACCEPQDAHTCPRLSPGFLASASLAAHVSVPLMSTVRVLGILNFGWRGSHTLSEAEKALLASISGQLSVALEKAELYSAATRRTGRLAMINRIGEALTTSLDLDSVLDSLLESLTPAVEAGAAGVALAEEADEQGTGQTGRVPDDSSMPVLVYRRATGPGAQDVPGRRIDEADSLAAQAVTTRSRVIRRNAVAGQAVFWRAGCLVGGDQICLPLIAGEHIIGAIELAKDGPEGLDGEDLQVLEAVAAQAAVAIENALLYQRQRSQYRRLQESQAQLIQAEKSSALGALAAAMAHEINNPLQSLRGHIDMAIDFPLKRQERAEYLRIARREIVRLSEITHRILNFYKPSQAARHAVQVNALIEQALLLAGKQLERAHIAVGLDLANAQPVTAAPDELMQVFLNVLLNGIDAIDGSGHIRIATASDAEHVVMTFANDGPPIASEHLSRIFAPNFTTKLGGTGLGLFVARTIVHQHQGTIDAENLSGGSGVVFTIRLPIACCPETS